MCYNIVVGVDRMNRPEREKPPFYGGSNKSKNDLPPRRSVSRIQRVSLGIPVYLMITRFRGNHIPRESLISDKGKKFFLTFEEEIR